MPTRTALTDACPGIARPFHATDGSIVRMRTGGRPVRVAALAELLTCVAGQADAHIQLTSRGALQLRGLPDPLPTDLRERLAAVGLLPSPTHELVRNIVTSPLTGLSGGLVDLRGLVSDLDAALCADPDLARLPGRFLFALDDGRRDVIGERFDIAVLALSDADALVFAGTAGHGVRVRLDDAVDAALTLARGFLSARDAGGGTAWHIDELPEPLAPALGAELAGGLSDALGTGVAPGSPRPVGAVGTHAAVGVPLGLLTAPMLDALAAVTDRVLVTPWRSLVIEDAASDLPALAAGGLVTDPASPWLRLHACTGSPGCARSEIDTRGLARALAPRLASRGRQVHVSGCVRRCGTPASGHVDLVAPASVDEALAAIAAAR